MNFKHPEEELSSYVSGELDEVEKRQVEEHLRECSECTEKVAELRQLNELLNEADVLEPSPFFAKRVLARVEEEKKIIAFRSRRTIAWFTLAASIAFLAFLLSVRWKVTPPPPIVHWRPKIHETGHQSQPVVAPPVQPKRNPTATEVSNEDSELIANLDALENFDVIQNYDDLQYLEAAVVSNGEEKTE